MLNNRRIRVMTRLAAYEQTSQGREDIRTSRFYKMDYVRFHILKTIVSITAAYGIILGLIGIYKMEYLISKAVTLDYKHIGSVILGIYIILIVVSVLAAVLLYSFKFVESRKRLSVYNRKLKELRQIYREEETI